MKVEDTIRDYLSKHNLGIRDVVIKVYNCTCNFSKLPCTKCNNLGVYRTIKRKEIENEKV